MSGHVDIGPQVARTVAEVAASLPEGTRLDIQSLQLDLPHDAGPDEIRAAVQVALSREAGP